MIVQCIRIFLSDMQRGVAVIEKERIEKYLSFVVVVEIMDFEVVVE